MRNLVLVIIIIFLILPLYSIAQNKYIGLKPCIACHKGTKGNMVYEKWSKTKHAQAFNTMK